MTKQKKYIKKNVLIFILKVVKILMEWMKVLMIKKMRNNTTKKHLNKTNMKQTAIDWLIDQLEKYELYSKISFQCLKEIEQAKVMEKEQMIEFYIKGCEDTYGMDEGDNDRKDAEQYYEKTFKQD
jgi:hypothetical protein